MWRSTDKRWRRAAICAGLAGFSLRLYGQVSPGASNGTLPERVPFVGCPSDGQAGPQPAKPGESRLVRVDLSTARKISYYQADSGPGVLAPRGWHCFGVYGSSGSSLFVTPQPIDPGWPLSEKWRGFSGPAIQATSLSGETSGRFGVARVIARVFPKERDFVQHVIDEGFEPASDFPFGAFPNDRLVYRSDRVVEYRTPPRVEGLGTMSRLQPDSEPIEGVAILTTPETSLFKLSIRVPEGLRSLIRPMIAQFERESIP